MTDAQLAELKKLEQAATDGPWEHGEPLHFNHGIYVFSGGVPSSTANHPFGVCIVNSRCADGTACPTTCKANADFIAAARAAVPKLIAEVEDLRRLMKAAGLWRHNRPVITREMAKNLPCPFPPETDL